MTHARAPSPSLLGLRPPAEVASCKGSTRYTMPLHRTASSQVHQASRGEEILNARNAWGLVLQAQKESSAFEHSFLLAHLYCGHS